MNPTPPRSIARAFSLALLLFSIGCARARDGNDTRVYAVATTSIVGDAAHIIGGTNVRVIALMGAGVDPHLYKASEGDVLKMAEADIIFYNGIHLEGKLANLLDKIALKKNAVAIAEAIPPSECIRSGDFDGLYDPHVWFDVELWMEAVERVYTALAEFDAPRASYYKANWTRYQKELEALHAYVKERAEMVPVSKRVLVTAHDAFGYFGRAYGFSVYGLQGMNTVTEISANDVDRLAALLAENKTPAIFIETSLNARFIEALQKATRAKGFPVTIGGALYSDALGTPGTPEATYIGMMTHTIDTIVEGLLGETKD